MMCRQILWMLAIAALSASRAHAADSSEAATIIALERGALDRWGKGDPQGYLDLYANDVTYIDPIHEKRLDGIEPIRKMLVSFTGKIKIDRYEILNPKVQRSGGLAVLSYNLVNYRKRPDGGFATLRWNATAVYRRTGNTWKIVHNHWSYTKPELKQPSPE